MMQTLIDSAGEGVEFRQPWLKSATYDGLWIIGPAFISAGLALVLKPQIEQFQALPLWAWVSFVLFVDVAHVYATLFRTYLNQNAWQQHKSLLIGIPIVCWAVGAMLYSVDALFFWRCLAYLAVFHFMRQQYGFLALYSRTDSPLARRFQILDQFCLYAAVLFPLVFWHTHMPRNFNWFVEGDFVESTPAFLADVGFLLYAISAVLFLLKECFLFSRLKIINWPKLLTILGTAFSWWVAIIAINSDLSFTLVNVISHGVPYMALIWMYMHKPTSSQSEVPEASPLLEMLASVCARYLPAFILLLFVCAYLEEGLWDGFIWREHLNVFAPFVVLPAIADKSIMALLIPFLALPQSTHYVLDGFIWKVRNKKSIWSA